MSDLQSLSAMERGILECIATADPKIENAGKAADQCGVGLAEARAAIERLIHAGLVEAVPGSRRNDVRVPPHFDVTSAGRDTLVGG